MNDEQREGLGEALVDSLVEVWQSDDTVVIHADQIDPAIDAIAEYLWQRADDPEVVREAAIRIADYRRGRQAMGENTTSDEIAHFALPHILAALIGPRPNGEESEK